LITEDSCSLEQTNFIAAARAHLCWLFGVSDVPAPDVCLDRTFERVNVTLRTGGAVRGSMSGHGDNLRDQLLDAVYRASRDERFSRRIVRADLKNLSIEVWLQVSSQLIPLERREAPDAIRLGEDGVEVEQGSAFAYYKPSVAIISDFGDAQSLFRALCKKADLPEDCWRNSSCTLRKTSWIHLCETPDHRVIQMTALRPPRTFAITTDALIEWVESGARYLKNNQHSDGSFCYQYRPFLNTARKREANPVRASGCAYAIAAAASSPYLDSRKDLTECAKRAAEAILRRCTPLKSGGCYVADRPGGRGGKLGTSALLLLALMMPVLQPKHEEDIERILTGIKSSQLESGLFECTFGRAETTKSQINFFPGQAILALIVRAEQGDESCRRYYRAAFSPYRDHFRNAPSTAFVGWHADAWSRAALLDSNQEYAEFVFEQIDWLLQFQLQGQDRPFASGGFSWNGKPPGYSSIVYTEALARGTALAHKCGDKRWLKYGDAFRAGMAFCSRLRLTSEQSIFFPDPERAIGGMATSLSDFEVRSDVVQHAITLGIAALDIMELLD